MASLDWRTGRSRRLSSCAIGSVVILDTFDIVIVEPKHGTGPCSSATVFYVADALKCRNLCMYRKAALKRWLNGFEITKSAWIYDVILSNFNEISNNIEFYLKNTRRLAITQSYSVAVPRKR